MGKQSKKPTQSASVCRMVHYYPCEGHEQPGPFAAVVAEVVDAKSQECTLVVFSPCHGATLEQRVPFADKPRPGAWSWPDYAPHVPNHVLAELEAEAVEKAKESEPESSGGMDLSGPAAPADQQATEPAPLQAVIGP